MANQDNRHEPEHPSDDDAELPLEKTAHIESEDASTRDDEASSGGESTLIPLEERDTNQTVSPSTPSGDLSTSKSQDTDGSVSEESDLDATVANIESTIEMEESSEIEATIAVDKTVGAGDIDHTVAIDNEDSAENLSSDGISVNRPTVYMGKAKRGPSDLTVRDAQEATLDGMESHPSVQTVDSSVLASANIGETINPRELSKSDAKAWNSAVGQKSEDSNKTHESDGDAHHTLVDKQFGRLRRQSIAPLKSEPKVTKDYKLVRKLGQGGMGDVYVARQGSLDRLLALKLIKPLDGARRTQLEKTGKLASVEKERRQQFLSEAIVTGDLDHPNIVPIHDVALTSSNELFYVMKRVVGTPWSKVIKNKSQDENIEILLKACDAIGFAHERGVVHRDIKPENIMLGDFGVVMVMDWGLALPTSNYEKENSIFATSGLGGTPAFMAPEMATGPLERIGPASDIYLLGATLFMIVTGSAPHKAKNVTECLQSVRRNTIRAVPESKKGELLDIAMRAMATEPNDRFPDVASFQRAIREYRAHAESVSLTVRANEDLNQGREEKSYGPLSRAVFRFEEALKSWPGNEKAHAGLAEAKLEHANTAYSNGDFDLGLSLLDRENPRHKELIEKIEGGIAERDSHAARVSALRKLAVAMLAFILVGGGVALVIIERERSEATLAATAERRAKNDALRAKQEAENAAAAEEKAKLEAVAAREKAEDAAAAEEKAKLEAVAAREKAEDAAAAEEKAKLEAVAAREKAEDAAAAEKKAKDEAVAARDEADAARAKETLAKEQAVKSSIRAEYEEYVSKIGLAKARLERNEADGAREILIDLRDNPHSTDRADGWEWRWLWRQANQADSTEKSEGPLIDLGMGPQGRLGAVVLADGLVDLLNLDAEGQLIDRSSLNASILDQEQATCVAISPSEQTLAIGTAAGDVFLVDGVTEGSIATDDIRIMHGHDGSVTDLHFSDDDTLLSASIDRTLRAWDARSGTELTKVAACWHILPVRQIAVTKIGSTLVVVAAIADDSTGQVAIWRMKRQDSEMKFERLGTQDEHQFPVASVAINRDARLVASGDTDGNVLVWNPAKVPATNYAGSIRSALKILQEGSVDELQTPPRKGELVGLPLVDGTIDMAQRLVSTSTSDTEPSIPQAHQDVVNTIRFSGDGESLLTGSDDATLKVWDLQSKTLRKTLKGHGGWVVGAEFLAGKNDEIISASNDATVRTWKPKTYVGAFKVQQFDAPGVAQSTPDSRASNSMPRQAQAHQDEIWSASFSRDGTKVVTASRDNTARVMSIDPETLDFNKLIRLNEEVLAEGTSFVAMSIQIDRAHDRLYVGSADATVRVWDLKRGTQLSEANGTGLNTSFAVSDDGQWMLTGSSAADVKAILWQLDPEGKSPPRRVLEMPRAEDEEAITAFAISPDSKTLFTGDRIGIGVLWDAATGKRIGQPIENVRTYRINAATFTKDGTSLMLAADNAALTVVNLATRQSTNVYEHVGYVTQLSSTPDGRYALTVSEVTTDTEAKSIATLWDLDSGLGRVLDRFISTVASTGSKRQRARITSASFDDSGRLVVVSRASFGNQPAQLRLWETDAITGKGEFQDSATVNSANLSATRSSEEGQVFELPSILGVAEAVLPLRGKSMLTMNKNAVFQWDLQSKRMVKSYRAHAELTEASFSADGKYIATGSRSVKIWDAASGKALAKLESPRPIRSVQFSPSEPSNGMYMFATGGDEGVAKLWTFEPTNHEIKPLSSVSSETEKTKKRTIRRIRFSPNGQRLLVVGDDGLAVVNHLTSPQDSMDLEVPYHENLLCAAFSQDGRYVGAGSVEKHVVVWKLPKSEEEPSLVVLEGHAGLVNDITFMGSDANTLRVLTASADDTARVWDPRLGVTDVDGNLVGGREIISLRRHRGDVTAIDATPNGSLLLTAGRDGKVILWPADPPPPNIFETTEDEKPVKQ